MPRKNNKHKIKFQPFEMTVHPENKKRYHSKREAERAAELAMMDNFSLELTVYKGLDGGWYLTSKK